MQTLKNILEAFGAVLALAWDYIRDFWKWLGNGMSFAELLIACAILGLVWFTGMVLWACLA
jgi:hypothetical protein